MLVLFLLILFEDYLFKAIDDLMKFDNLVLVFIFEAAEMTNVLSLNLPIPFLVFLQLQLNRNLNKVHHW